jgi:hypothetical protein
MAEGIKKISDDVRKIAPGSAKIGVYVYDAEDREAEKLATERFIEQAKRRFASRNE